MWLGVFVFELAHPVSIVPCLAGVVIGCRRLARVALVLASDPVSDFMVPVPSHFANILSQPLQRIGAMASTSIIQTLGIPSVARGNIIVLPETELGVAEACNGLPMMMLFFAVCFGAVFLSDRRWYEKLFILAAAAPIAVLANVIRITGTAVLYQVSGVDLGNKFFHDLAGWFMMPMAVVLLWILLWILDHALVTPEQQRPLMIET
jgi:exosortase